MMAIYDGDFHIFEPDTSGRSSLESLLIQNDMMVIFKFSRQKTHSGKIYVTSHPQNIAMSHPCHIALSRRMAMPMQHCQVR